VADLCHRIESTLIEDNQRPSAEQRAQLEALWANVGKHLAIVTGEHRDRLVEIEEADYQALLAAAQSLPVYEPIAAMLIAARLEPAGKRLGTLAEQAQGIARRLNKQPLSVEVKGHDVRLDARSWAPFWSSFVHLLRNAVDHGLEAPDVRKAAGKQQPAQLSLSTTVQGDELVVEIADDGRGIDWDRVAEVAASKGIPHGTRQELVEAIFYDGVSTSARVSEFSGRGVGMGAVRSACMARGGTIAVHSEPGKGTRVSFRFPLAAAAAAATSTTQPQLETQNAA